MSADTIRFSGIRAIKLIFRQFLEIIDELKIESENSNKNLEKTFQELESFLKKEHGVTVSLLPFVKYTNVLDENKSKLIRKRILDYGNSLIREIETQR